MTGTPWQDAPLVALDLEGTGAQDREDEAILEIATIPLVRGRPAMDHAYTTLINPGRPVPRRPWISPGLTDQILAAAPPLDQITPNLATRLEGQLVVGHNIAVDWRLLHHRCPRIRPAALIDTLRLARQIHPTNKRNSLTALLDLHELTQQVTDLAPGSQPHRALWDTTATALLLAALTQAAPGTGIHTLDQLQRFAGIPLDNPTAATEAEQLPLPDL